MNLNLLNSFGKKGVNYGLLTASADVIDVDYSSKYFIVSDFKSQFSGGKNTLAINGSPYLLPNSEIFIECIDSEGNYLYVEMAKTTDSSAQNNTYKESSAYIIAIHVYNDTADGVGKLILYGTLEDNKSVKWTRNIIIDKTLKNSSKIRFYQKPLLEVTPLLVPEVYTNKNVISKNFTANIHGLAVSPVKDTNLQSLTLRNINTDYRLVVDYPYINAITDESNACNSQMIDSIANLYINTIQSPLKTDSITPLNQTASFKINDVYNNTTLIIDPYIYKDSKNNNIVTNINSASLVVSYPFVVYNNDISSYVTTTLNNTSSIVVNSYADITYRNIRTFSGYVSRHKIYKRSLLSNDDFELVTDAPLLINEILKDEYTQNKYYENLGIFYNTNHLNRYWFSSSANINLSHTPDKYINSMFISSNNPNGLIGNDYVIVKNDSTASSANAVYTQYDETNYLSTIGTSYDSNFMALKANVQYIIEVSATILKDSNVTNAGIEFYFTSSLTNASKEPTFTNKYGVKLSTIIADNNLTSQNIDSNIQFFTPANDLYGTLVLVPYRCQAYIKNISVRVYGDDSFSPDVYSIRVPWPITSANESFEIKSELYDINHNLVYSDLRNLKEFDYSGSSLIPISTGGGGVVIPGSNDLYVKGNLIVSQSIELKNNSILIDVGTLYVPEMDSRISSTQTRLVSVSETDFNNNGILNYSPIVDINHDDTHLYLTTNPTVGPGQFVNTVSSVTRKSLACDYTSTIGRKIYYVGSTKTTESGTNF